MGTEHHTIDTSVEDMIFAEKKIEFNGTFSRYPLVLSVTFYVENSFRTTQSMISTQLNQSVMTGKQTNPLINQTVIKVKRYLDKG